MVPRKKKWPAPKNTLVTLNAKMSEIVENILAIENVVLALIAQLVINNVTKLWHVVITNVILDVTGVHATLAH